MTVVLNHKETAEILLAHQANIAARDKTGRTPLHWSVSYNGNLADILLAHGADVNARDDSGNTPLHAAVNGSQSLVALLLDHHADVNPKNDDGNTPLDLRFQRLGHSPVNLAPHGLDKTGDAITDLLREHGAITELESGTIRITGKDQPTLTVVFRRDANSYNHFTLFDTIANAYSPADAGSWRATDAPAGLQFPDFTKVKIRRFQPDGATNILSVDLDAMFAAEDCSGDIPMQWGDIVEIPELDHKVTDSWGGLSDQARLTLDKCLRCEVEIIVKGQSTKVSIKNPLAGFIRSALALEEIRKINGFGKTDKPQLACPRLNDVVRRANVILASSDLTRVKVKRVNPATHKTDEMVFNLEKVNPPTDLWLRDGDIIEIPEKP